MNCKEERTSADVYPAGFISIHQYRNTKLYIDIRWTMVVYRPIKISMNKIYKLKYRHINPCFVFEIISQCRHNDQFQKSLTCTFKIANSPFGANDKPLKMDYNHCLRLVWHFLILEVVYAYSRPSYWWSPMPRSSVITQQFTAE